MKTFVAIAVLWLPLLAVAQAPDSNGASGDGVPPSPCIQPVPPPRVQPRSEDLDRFSGELMLYRKCVEVYVRDRSDEMKRHNALARANADAANVAVQKLNDFISKLGVN